MELTREKEIYAKQEEFTKNIHKLFTEFKRNILQEELTEEEIKDINICGRNGIYIEDFLETIKDLLETEIHSKEFDKPNSD